LNYYRRYVGDYLRDTARLSMLEHGAYNLLLDYYYADEKPLPDDKEEIYLMVRAMHAADRKAVDKILGLYFTWQPDGYHQKRVDHEIAVSQSARANGKQGGRPHKPFAKPDTEPDHEPEWKPLSETEVVTGLETGSVSESIPGSGHPPTTNHQPPASIPQPERKPSRKKSATALPPDFGISDRVKDWAAEKGHRYLAEHLEAFVSKVKAKGYTYVDWDEAFMNAVREDWAKVGERMPKAGPTSNAHVAFKPEAPVVRSVLSDDARDRLRKALQ
jgi:uncharacterized protein YdaU (DUF1376 family)